MFYNDDVEFRPGDKVVHDNFGKGIVISVEKSIITVAFSYPHQVKKLLKNHKTIRKE
jgi:DNA helicase-2/ATP-dependent DNA helicase PcrA